jgi:hypothetical protein
MHRYELRAWLSAVLANLSLNGGQSVAAWIWVGLALIWVVASLFKEVE